MTTLIKKDLYRPDEVASYFGVTVKTIYRWIDAGKLEAVKIGGKLVKIPYKSIVKVQKPT